MLQWLLALNGVKSSSAVNGYQAILDFERADPRFDLIFLDNTMPVMVSPSSSCDINRFTTL